MAPSGDTLLKSDAPRSDGGSLLPDGTPNPVRRQIWAYVRNTWRHQGFSGFLIIYPFAYEWIMAIVVSKKPEELKFIINKQIDSNILMSGLLLGSAFSCMGTGAQLADIAGWGQTYADGIEVLAFTTTMMCILALLFNFYLQAVINGLGDANVHCWVVANDHLVIGCNVVIVAALFLFAFGLFIYGLATTTSPAMLWLVMMGFFAVEIWCLILLGGGAAFSAAHSGALSEVPVIKDMFAVKEHAHAARLLADKALENDGDRMSMVLLYKRINELEKENALLKSKQGKELQA